MTLDRDRLAKLLGMLGSSHDGEVLNAARAAERMVQGANVTWHEVLSVTNAELEEEDQGHPEELTDRLRCLYLLRNCDVTPWEYSFLNSIYDKRLTLGFQLTPRQREVFERLWVKYRG